VAVHTRAARVMYRSKLWTMRQFAGFGTSEDTNERFPPTPRGRCTGLSTAFDMRRCSVAIRIIRSRLGEVGRAGVAVDTLADMESLRQYRSRVGHHLDDDQSAAPTLLAMYVAVADKTGVLDNDWRTIQHDILKELPSAEGVHFPPRPSMRLVTDTIRFASAERAPLESRVDLRLHIREAGSTAAQELAFTLANASRTWSPRCRPNSPSTISRPD